MEFIGNDILRHAMQLRTHQLEDPLNLRYLRFHGRVLQQPLRNLSDKNMKS